ncbi:kinase-like protein [Polychaeton citri CBS 116435]|uniref:non-specific serine/threonine protein kinase n=1 Tax=Polychaeton citri CBS 116435 TaxID=1314669 RepID=A0A9P4QF46_9PEZI|nr:kinase-like protein [Polychaeton citri CBS 116435]
MLGCRGSRHRHQPQPLSKVLAPGISASLLLGEEKTPHYNPGHFHSARFGQVFYNRYQFVTKLGYGPSSIERYVAIKINSISRYSRKNDIGSELKISEHISANPQYKGWHFVREMMDSSTIEGSNGSHVCMVFELLREPLWLYRQRYVGRVVPTEILKTIVQMILHGVDYLHSECHVIHTAVQAEYNDTLPQKHMNGRTNHLSRNDYGKLARPNGTIQITDYDFAVSGEAPHSGCIQADFYRALEILPDVGYNYPGDIWNLGLFEQPSPDSTGDHDDQLHLAQLAALLGPQPSELFHGQRTSAFYSSDGNLRNKALVPSDLTLENSISQIKGQEKEKFLKFVKRMTRWILEDRSTAKELLDDPWLFTGHPQD